jgi:RND family efflux transporter MFP subunit
LAAAAVACGKEAPAAPPPPQVTVAKVLERDIPEWDEFSGRLQAVDAVEVRPRVSGYIERVAFEEGKEVRQGDVLFVIDPRPYQAEFDRAQAQLEQARSRLELARKDVARARTLVARQAISREELDSRTSAETEAQAAVRAAAAAVESAQLNLEWTRVRAPISGRASRAEVTVGNLVQAGAPSPTLLTTIMSVDPVYVYFDTDEQTYLKYRGAQPGTRDAWRNTRHPVYLGLANEQGFPHEGYLDFIDNQIDPTTGTIRARAVFSNAARLFTPGLFARVKLVGSEKKRVAVIRDAAVGTNQDRKFVLVLKPDHTVEYRRVELGRVLDGGLRIVESGLTAGERIVVNGLQRVRPGMKVTAAEEAMVADSSATTIAANR